MKTAIEIPVAEINFLLLNEVKSIIEKFSAEDDILFYFLHEDNAALESKVFPFLTYMEEIFPQRQFAYILSSELQPQGEFVLFSTLLYQEAPVNRDAISLKVPVVDLQRLLMNLTFADCCFFADNIPLYLGAPWQYKENVKALFQKQKMSAYPLFCKNRDFKAFIAHLPIHKDELEYLSRALSKNAEEFQNRYQDLRTEIIRQEALFLNRNRQPLSTNVTADFARDTLSFLRKISNFE